jgi:hypothetical protein
MNKPIEQPLKFFDRDGTIKHTLLLLAQLTAVLEKKGLITVEELEEMKPRIEQEWEQHQAEAREALRDRCKDEWGGFGDCFFNMIDGFPKKDKSDG